MSHSAPFTPKTMTLGTGFRPLCSCANDKQHPTSRTAARMRLVLLLINFITAPFTESACIIAQRRYSLREYKRDEFLCSDAHREPRCIHYTPECWMERPSSRVQQT